LNCEAVDAPDYSWTPRQPAVGGQGA
jgi:hypothetical protein